MILLRCATAVCRKRADSAMSSLTILRARSRNRRRNAGVALQELEQIAAGALQLLAEALQIHERPAHVVRDAVDERLVLVGSSPKACGWSPRAVPHATSIAR